MTECLEEEVMAQAHKRITRVNPRNLPSLKPRESLVASSHRERAGLDRRGMDVSPPLTKAL